TSSPATRSSPAMWSAIATLRRSANRTQAPPSHGNGWQRQESAAGTTKPRQRNSPGNICAKGYRRLQSSSKNCGGPDTRRPTAVYWTKPPVASSAHSRCIIGPPCMTVSPTPKLWQFWTPCPEAGSTAHSTLVWRPLHAPYQPQTQQDRQYRPVDQRFAEIHLATAH